MNSLEQQHEEEIKKHMAEMMGGKAGNQGRRESIDNMTDEEKSALDEKNITTHQNTIEENKKGMGFDAASTHGRYAAQSVAGLLCGDASPERQMQSYQSAFVEIAFGIMSFVRNRGRAISSVVNQAFSDGGGSRSSEDLLRVAAEKLGKSHIEDALKPGSKLNMAEAVQQTAAAMRSGGVPEVATVRMASPKIR